MPDAAVLAPPISPPPVPPPPVPPVPRPPKIPPLRHGDRLHADEYLRRYWAMPEDFRAELIGGVVFVDDPAVPVRHRHHGKPTGLMTLAVGTYSAATPGTDFGTDGTTILGDREIPQPDTMLRVLPAHGGRTRDTDDDLIEGGPEFVAEMAGSTANTDLGGKFDAYLAAGVREYLVWRTGGRHAGVTWHARRGEGDAVRFEPLPAEGGVIRSEVFPGLWLNVAALLRGDAAGVLASLNAGLATPEHAAFAGELAARGPGPGGG